MTILNGFKQVDLSSTNGMGSTPTIKVTDSSVTFNRGFCRELNFAQFIELYVDIKNHKVAFMGTNTETKVSRHFCQPKKSKKVSGVYWTGKSIRHVIDVSLNRKSGQILKLVGSKENGAIVFNYGNTDQATN